MTESTSTPASDIHDCSKQYADVAANPTEEALTGVLDAVFGFPQFRGLQLATLRHVLRGQSCLSIMPTGQ